MNRTTLKTAALLTAAPVGTALGGPLTAALGPRPVLAASGLATIALAVVAMVMWAWGRRRGAVGGGAPAGGAAKGDENGERHPADRAPGADQEPRSRHH